MAARLCALGICALVSVLGVGACSSSSPAATSAPSTSAPSTQKPRFVAAAPPTKTIALRNGLLLLAPLAAGDKAAVTAATAFDQCANGVPGLVGTVVGPVPTPDVELTRATIKDWGRAHANGTVTPFVGHRLVWIIWYKAVPVRSRINKATPTPQPAVTGKTDVMTFVDARSGRCLNTEGFASTLDPR